MNYEMLTIQQIKEGLQITQRLDSSIADLITSVTYSNNVPIALPEDMVLFSLINLKDTSLTVIIDKDKTFTKSQKEQFLKYLFNTYLIPQVKRGELYIKCKNKTGLIFFISEKEERLLSSYSIDDAEVITKDLISEILEVGIPFEDALKEILKQAIKIEGKNNEK